MFALLFFISVYKRCCCIVQDSCWKCFLSHSEFICWFVGRFIWGSGSFSVTNGLNDVSFAHLLGIKSEVVPNPMLPKHSGAPNRWINLPL